MPWNEPEDKTRRNRNEPPDLDELFAKFMRFFDRFGGTGKPSSSGSGSNAPFMQWAIIALIAAALIAWVVAGFHVIDQQERGVLFRLGRYEATLQPGLQWQPPLIDAIETINTTRIREVSTQGRMLTKDENIIQATVLAQYRVINPKNYLIDLRRPELALSNALDSALRHVVGSSDMNVVLTDGRAEVAAIIRQRLQNSLDEYKSGMEIVKVNIEKTQAPSEVQDAFDDVIKAREDKQRFKNQADAYENQIIPQARGTAKRMLAEAEGYKEQVVNIATGQAVRFEKILTEYNKAPQVTQERLYIETQEAIMKRVTKVIIDSDSGNNITILPLEALLQRAQKTQQKMHNAISNDGLDTNSIQNPRATGASRSADTTRRGL